MKSPNSKIKLINHPSWPANQKGFTLLEVLVAILAVTLFFAFSLEGMVLASLAQIRAREKAEASLFIQRDLEEIKVLAAKYGINPPLSETEIEARCDGIGGEGGNEGFAASLATAISADTDLEVPDEVTLQASTRSYSLERTIVPSTGSPNILGIRYTISDGNTDRPPLAELYTEVISSAVLQCPTPPQPGPPPGTPGFP